MINVLYIGKKVMLAPPIFAQCLFTKHHQLVPFFGPK